MFQCPQINGQRFARLEGVFLQAGYPCMLTPSSARQWMQQSLRESDRALQQVARAADR